jgi:hypothetical protein
MNLGDVPGRLARAANISPDFMRTYFSKQLGEVHCFLQVPANEVFLRIKG